MSAFSSLLSSLDKTAQPSQSVPTAQRAKPAAQNSTKPAGSANLVKLTPTNGVAGVKRKAEDEATQTKSVNPVRPTTAGGRFQLTTKGKATERSIPNISKSTPPSTSTAGKSQRPSTTLPPKLAPVSSNNVAATPSSATPTTATSSKKGFAAILEKAKTAQAAAAAANAGGIKHKPMEKMSRKERLRLMEEHKAAKKSGGKAVLADRSRSGTPSGSAVKGAPVKTGYQGTMKKVVPTAEPGYKGTMRAVGAGGAKPKPKEGQRRANEYVDWSDLDEEQDDYGDEEDDYGSEASDDMEGGFDDMQEEEEMALRAAKKEDMEALQEEERLKREKLARKRKLQELSKSAAAKKRY